MSKVEDLRKTQETLDIIMCSDSENEEQEEALEREDENINTEDDADMKPQLESSSDSSDDSESRGNTEETAVGWSSKNGQIKWSPTNAVTPHNIPAATGLIPDQQARPPPGSTPQGPPLTCF